MDQSNILCLSLLVVFGLIIIHYFQTTSNGIEGLTQPKSKPSTSGGEASGSANYLANLKASVINLQDQLLINKYKSDYDIVLVQMDDYLNLMMLKQILNINIQKKGGDISDFDNLVTLQKAKESLNDIVTYLDK